MLRNSFTNLLVKTKLKGFFCLGVLAFWELPAISQGNNRNIPKKVMMSARYDVIDFLTCARHSLYYEHYVCQVS